MSDELTQAEEQKRFKWTVEFEVAGIFDGREITVRLASLAPLRSPERSTGHWPGSIGII